MVRVSCLTVSAAASIVGCDYTHSVGGGGRERARTGAAAKCESETTRVWLLTRYDGRASKRRDGKMAIKVEKN